MICETCQKQEAAVVYTHIVENKKKTVHLCSSCAAAEKDIQAGGAADAMLGKKMVAELSDLVTAEEPSAAQCQECGTTYEEFKKVGRFGCQACYATFTEQLERLFKRIHGSIRHHGKARIEQQAAMLPDEEVAQLRQELEAAVAEDAFEQAAQLRDRIIQLERRIGGDAPVSD